MNDIQKVCKIDLERRQLYTTIQYSSTNQLYFPTKEGNVIPISKDISLSIADYHKLINDIPNCILGIVSSDSSVVYYGIESSYIKFSDNINTSNNTNTSNTNNILNSNDNTNTNN